MGVRVVPYTVLYPATVEALPEAVFVEMDHADHYRQFLGEMWLRREEFTLIEHDVVPTHEQLDAFDTCPEPWCFYGYHPGHWIPVFGCVRFSKELIEGTQGVWDDPTWPWNQLDAKFTVKARGLGWKPHWHYPSVRHLRTGVNTTGIIERQEISTEIRQWLIDREAAEVDRLMA